jgi:hypothetical protein
MTDTVLGEQTAGDSNHSALYEAVGDSCARTRSVPDEHREYGFLAPSRGWHPFDSAFGSAQGERFLKAGPT